MELKDIELQWKNIYRIGSVCIFAAALAMITEILMTAHPEGARVPLNIRELFKMYERNWFMAMRYMGLINIVASTLMIPAFFSLYGLHREKYSVYAGLILILYLAGYIIFMADNSSFALLTLSGKYKIASAESIKSSLIVAGEALFAKGASHTPGTFPGFFISELSCILFSVIILKGRVFSKITGIIGIIGFSFLFVFEVCSSFIPSLFYISMIFAMIGGISVITWYILIGLKLLRV